MKTLVMILALALSGTAFAAVQPLAEETATQVKSVVDACVKVNKSGRLSIARDCSDILTLKNQGQNQDGGGDLYRGYVALGDQDLGLQVIVGAGMDRDENSVTFFDENQNEIANYP